MGRQPNIIRPQKLTLTLPEDFLARLTLFLYSEAEGRIPYGAVTKFFQARTEEYFNRKSLDLYQWSNPATIGTEFEPGQFVIYGSPASILALQKALSKE